MRQAGSLVAPDRLRFDFNHPDAMALNRSARQQIVNEAVAADMVYPHLKSRRHDRRRSHGFIW
jgi:alanyl-tRNA synthetase